MIETVIRVMVVIGSIAFFLYAMYETILTCKKNTNDKLHDIGFRCIKDDKHEVVYERKNESYFGGTYTHVLTICYKNNGRHIIQSYDKDLLDEKKIGNTNVGLTYYESKLIMKKMREKGWKSR